MRAIVKGLLAALAWVVDLKSLVRDTGRMVDFAYMQTLSGVNQFRRGGFRVKLAEAVSIGEAADIAVDALEQPLKQGDKISFGFYQPVIVTVGGGGAAQGATSITVTALSGPIPNGQLLYFGANKFAKLNADAPIGAVTLTVLALPTALSAADTATWQGGHKQLIIAADVNAGAIEIDVEAPIFSFDNGEVGGAMSAESGNGNTIYIPEGTVLVEVNPTTNRKIIPLIMHPSGINATGQIMVGLTNMKNDSKTDALTGYGVTYSGTLFENIMPDSIRNGGTLPTGWKALLGARYVWLISRDSRGA